MVGAQGRAHDCEETPQNAVLIGVYDAIQCFCDGHDERLFVVDALARVNGVEANEKQLHKLLRDGGVFGQSLFNVLLAESKASLFQISGIGT